MNVLLRSLLPVVMLCSCGGVELPEPEVQQAPALAHPPEDLGARSIASVDFYRPPLFQAFCPDDRPQHCESTEALGSGCFSAAADCSTRVSCGESVFACPPGQHAICPSGACTETFPDWLRAWWTNEPTVYAASRRVAFWPDHYTWWAGSTHERSGELTVIDGRMTFYGGPLEDSSVMMATAFS